MDNHIGNHCGIQSYHSHHDNARQTTQPQPLVHTATVQRSCHWARDSNGQSLGLWDNCKCKIHRDILGGKPKKPAAQIPISMSPQMDQMDKDHVRLVDSVESRQVQSTMHRMTCLYHESTWSLFLCRLKLQCPRDHIFYPGFTEAERTCCQGSSGGFCLSQVQYRNRQSEILKHKIKNNKRINDKSY